MPRGFLVKRTKRQVSPTSTTRLTISEDDRSESGSELDTPLLIHTSAYQHPYGSPDSGFSQSPVNLTTKNNRNSDVDASRSDDNNSDCQSTSGKDTSNNDRSPGSDIDEGHVQGKLETYNNNISPKNHVMGSMPPLLTSIGSRAYGVPPRAMPSPLSISTSAGNSPSFYFSAFDRLAVTSPKGHRFQPGAQFMPPPGMFPGYPPMPMPNRMMMSSPVSPATAVSPNKRKTEHTETGLTPKSKSAKKPKAARKIHFDEDKSSPVSGTIIRDAADVGEDVGIRVVSGDIDASLNFVEVTPEAREEISKIENKIGAYVCQLCKENYDDAFQLAQHRCSRIIHVEYRCPECDKVFNCPANLASHRRWHKPRPNANNSNVDNGTNNNNINNNNKTKSSTKTTDTKRALDAINGNITNGHLHPAMFVDNMNKLMMGRGVENMMHSGPRKTPSPDGVDNEGLFECDKCGKKFRRQAYLRKHMVSHIDSDMTLPCPLCSKIFRGESERTKHIVQFHNNPSSGTVPGLVINSEQHQQKLCDSRGEYTCALCGNHLNSQLDLEHHQRRHHPNEIYACKYCTAVFYSSPGLTRHINKCHPSENRQVILLHMPPMAPPINSPC